MASNDFLPFAAGGAANVLTQAQYAALGSVLTNGFTAGTAISQQLNKVWRQSSLMAAILGAFIADITNQNVVDDGTTATILSNLMTAVMLAGYADDTGVVNAYAVTLSPSPLSYYDGMRIGFSTANANTNTTPTLNVNGLGAITITGKNGIALDIGRITANTIIHVVYNSTGPKFEIQDAQNFMQSSAGAVARTLQSKLRSGDIDIADFGAVEDGVTDDSAAWTAAIAQAVANGGGKIRYHGVTKINSNITVNGDSIVIVGPGNHQGTAATFKPRILCGAAGAGLTFANTRGSRCEGVYIDDNGVATAPLTLDRMRFSTWRDTYVYCTNLSHSAAWLFTNTTAVVDDASDWNTFENCGAYGAKPFVFTNSTYVQNTNNGTGGTWHNTFINTSIGCTGSGAAIDLYVGDNITFIETYIFQYSTAVGVKWNYSSASGGYYPNSIYFYHLQAAGGISIGANVINPGAIYGYDMSNAQPFPTIPSGTKMTITTDGLNSPGWNLQRMIAAAVIKDRGASYSDSYLLKDDNGHGLVLWNSTNGNAAKAVLNSTTRALDLYVNPDGTGDVYADSIGGAWQQYTPTLTPGSGSFTTASAVGRYIQRGKLVFFNIVATITNAGTAAGTLTATLPSGPGNVMNQARIAFGYESVGGNGVIGICNSGTQNCVMTKFGGITVIASSQNVTMTGHYEVA